MKLESLRTLVDANHLLVYHDVVPSKLSKKAWRHAHKCGLLVRIHHEVSRLIDMPETPELLIADGWTVMEFNWHQINNRSAWVASRIRRTLMQRAAQLGLSPESRAT